MGKEYWLEALSLLRETVTDRSDMTIAVLYDKEQHSSNISTWKKGYLSSHIYGLLQISYK